jgi:hypothetical protein
MKPYKSGLPLVSDFENLIDSLPGRIKIAKLTTREVCQVAGIPRPTYYKQLKARSFTAGEVKTLLRTINKLNKRFKSVEVDDLAEPVAILPPIDQIVLTPEERELLFELQMQRDEENWGKPPVDPTIQFRELVTQIVAQRDK